MNSRRGFIKQATVTTTGALLFGNLFASEGDLVDQLPRHILLRSGWQIENIGDIAHTPAMLALIEKYIPAAIVTFWPWYAVLPENELKMLQKRFPKMKLVRGILDKDGKASTMELQEAIATADFLLHNSGPATIAWADLTTFKKITQKPFGVYGVTYGLYGTPEQKILSDAAFVYFRDSVSLQKAKDAGVHAPIMGFSPDAVFSIDVTDDEKAITFLADRGLEHGKFICCIPKHRNTPMWLHPNKNRPFDPVKNARNEEMKEHDHEPLRQAIVNVVRKTNLKILLCHEDETEMIIGKEWLWDKLPDDVKPRVVWLSRPWLTDEAISIYKRSAGFFGSEMHSPIMCIAHDVPAVVVRWEEQSSKGIMWRDIGLSEWLFDFDKETDVQRFVPAVLAMVQNPGASKKKAIKARKFAQSRQKETMKQVEKDSRHVGK
ncbi:MAG: polysaccharide pyruvyl transferase family protein [Gloeobacteraceae cyanobacterium ES-bin-316]|nr:polysaccharide pyruvyl transferase family protein [Ferruginibacter sp.]